MPLFIARHKKHLVFSFQKCFRGSNEHLAVVTNLGV